MRFRHIAFILPAMVLQGCFTGIESTPRISYSDVKKENITTTPEQTFLADLRTPPPTRWEKGKRFHVTDDKISLIFTPSAEIDTLRLKGTDIGFEELGSAQSLAGDDVAVLTFVTGSGKRLSYKTDIAYADALGREDIDIPFTIDMAVVDSVRERLKGHRYYIVTPKWYTAAGDNAVAGLRHVPVDVADVQPGNSVYPLRVIFHPADEPEKTYSVFMTYGTRRTATRNFDTLMAFTNPREKYPQITDEIWELIKHSRVRTGMTKTECRLALGTPNVSGQRPTTAGMVEYWQYTDGVYLIFEEGYLAGFRN